MPKPIEEADNTSDTFDTSDTSDTAVGTESTESTESTRPTVGKTTVGTAPTVISPQDLEDMQTRIEELASGLRNTAAENAELRRLVEATGKVSVPSPTVDVTISQEDLESMTVAERANYNALQQLAKQQAEADKQVAALVNKVKAGEVNTAILQGTNTAVATARDYVVKKYGGEGREALNEAICNRIRSDAANWLYKDHTMKIPVSEIQRRIRDLDNEYAPLLAERTHKQAKSPDTLSTEESEQVVTQKNSSNEIPGGGTVKPGDTDPGDRDLTLRERSDSIMARLNKLVRRS